MTSQLIDDLYSIKEKPAGDAQDKAEADVAGKGADCSKELELKSEGSAKLSGPRTGCEDSKPPRRPRIQSAQHCCHEPEDHSLRTWERKLRRTIVRAYEGVADYRRKTEMPNERDHRPWLVTKPTAPSVWETVAPLICKP